MANPKRTEITIETKKVTVIRTRRTGDYIFCPRCSVIALPLTLSEAAAAIDATAGEVASGLDSGRFHPIDHSGRTLKICGNSIAASEGITKRKEKED